MKKKLISILLAFILGGTMAIITYYKINLKSKNNAYIYQLGIYKDYNNALNKANLSNGALIAKKDDMYQVIGAISLNEEAKAEKVLDEKQLDYYKKEVKLDDNLIKTISEYELLIDKTEDLDLLTKLNNDLLKELQERISND